MDYDGKYTGPEIDARLAQVDKNKENIKKIKSNNPFRGVVCGRRIPNLNWGNVAVRFSQSPTFVIPYNDIIDEHPITYAYIPPIMKMLLEQEIIEPDYNYQGGHWEILEDGIIQIQSEFNYVTIDNEPSLALFKFKYTEEDKNAIKLIGYDSDDNPIFKAIRVEHSETLSPYLIIKYGKICAQGAPNVQLEYTGGSDEIDVKISERCFYQYRRTSSQARTSHRKIKWSWVRDFHGVRKLSNISGKPKYFTARQGRKIIWLRVFKAIRGGRWISPTFTEVKKVILIR